MSIQWSLVLFTALTGLAGWLFACVAIDAVRGKNTSRAFLATVVAFAAMVVGGLASVTHLSHPTRMLAALTHPASGIFIEAVLLGLSAACMIVFAIMLKKGVEGGALKAVAVLGAVFGVALSFMAGSSYMMSSTATWTTPLLPLGYLCTAIPCGAGAYLAIVGASAERKDSTLFAGIAGIGAVLGAIVALAFAYSSGCANDVLALLWGGCVVCGGVVPAACAFAASKSMGPVAAGSITVIGALIGAVSFRCIMWLVFDLVAIGAPYITNYAMI